jgi:hypothetical protein
MRHPCSSAATDLLRQQMTERPAELGPLPHCIGRKVQVDGAANVLAQRRRLALIEPDRHPQRL